ncbi:MAG: outer membrane protein transport protein [Ghiorsea sp.]
MKQQLKFWSSCLVVVWCSTSQVNAAAIAYDEVTAGATGAANAVVAGASDLSAAFFNPAGLAWQEGVQALLGSQSRTRNLNANINGSSPEGEGSLGDLTTLAISWLPEGNDWGVSTTLSTPYSLNTDWADASFSNQLGETKIQMQRYSADSFWRVKNNLAASLGIDIYDASAKLNSGGASFSGSDWSKAGIHAGLRWEFVPFWVLGVNLRQGVDASVSDNTGASLNLQLPDELTIGVAHDLLDDELRLELDVKRTNWSSFADMNVMQNGVATQSLAVQFKDTTDIALGATWFWRHDTQLRFGYAYHEAANSLDNFQAALADLNGHQFSAGFGGAMSGMHLDMAYTYAYHPNADVSGVYAGNYADTKSSLMFSLTKKF